MLELSQPQTLAQATTTYCTSYPCAGRTHTYTFSIDACTPVRTTTKRELAQAYHPDLADRRLHDCFKRDTVRARQPAGMLSDDDQALARTDGYVYLADVLRDISPIDTAQRLTPAHVAAIMHFLGPMPDKEDRVALAA
ncbi:MAG: hypothetical protein IKP91_08975 [Bacteroidaceae bacterium]|nr:hypothetical protein [Bacteroidaceae bacterium]